MKRPFAVIGFTAFATLFFLFLFDRDSIAFFTVFTCTVGAILTFIRYNFRQALTVYVCLITAVCACFLFVRFNSESRKLYSLDKTCVKIEATVTQSPFRKSSETGHYCELSLEALNGKKAKGNLRLYFSPTRDAIDCDEFSAGNKIKLTATVSASGKSSKSIRRYFMSRNIFLSSYNITEISISKPESKTISYYADKLRNYANETLIRSFDDKIAGLLTGLLTGEKEYLDAELYDNFRKTGIAHLLAVSGLHLSVWVLSFSSLFPEKRRTKTPRSILLILAVIFIMLLAGMSESIKRAGLMCIVFLSSSFVKQKSDSINSLGFAVLLLILINPACVLSISLQLSFLSTLGILTLGKFYIKRSNMIFNRSGMNNCLKKPLKAATDSFFITISALIFTFPVLIYAFGGISSVTAFVNILISPIVPPLLLLVGIFTVISAMPFLSVPVGFLIKLFTEYAIYITELFSRPHYSFIDFSPGNLPLYFAAVGIILSFSLVFLKRSSGLRNTAAAGLALASVVLIISH